MKLSILEEQIQRIDDRKQDLINVLKEADGCAILIKTGKTYSWHTHLLNHSDVVCLCELAKSDAINSMRGDENE